MLRAVVAVYRVVELVPGARTIYTFGRPPDDYSEVPEFYLRSDVQLLACLHTVWAHNDQQKQAKRRKCTDCAWRKR